MCNQFGFSYATALEVAAQRFPVRGTSFQPERGDVWGCLAEDLVSKAIIIYAIRLRDRDTTMGVTDGALAGVRL